MIPNNGGAHQPPFVQVPPQGFNMQQQQQLLQQQQMQQQHMMMMMQRQQLGPQQAMYNMPGFTPFQQGFPPQRQIAPPQYTPQMAKEFKQKQSQMQKQQQKFLVDQKKQMENAMKQRQFQEQQKRLKEFTAIGGRKMDADRLIESIIGKTEVPKTQAADILPNSTTTTTVNSSQDDNFGDFMSGPAENMSSASPGVPNDPASVTRADNGSVAVNSTEYGIQPAAELSTESSPNLQTENKEDKKDLMTMMMQCSDLSAPQKAKGFVKPTVKEVQPSKKAGASFQESRQARRWDSSTQALTDLFTLPAAEPSPSTPSSELSSNEQTVNSTLTVSLPRWLTGQAALPEVYLHVLEASTEGDKISTERLYPILLRSNLPREKLGHLWSLCNKETPGQLKAQELFLLLAMISVAQNNLDSTSLEILTRCPQAPIPNLGQNSSAPAPNTSSDVGTSLPQTETSSTPAHNGISAPGTAISNGVMGQNTVNSGVQSISVTAADSDFADFQSAPCTGSFDSAPSKAFGDFKSAPDSTFPSKSSLSPIADLEPPSDEHEKEEDDIDEYFNGKKVVAPVPKSDPADPFQRNKKLFPTPSTKDNFSATNFDITPKAKPETIMPDFDNLSAFAGSQSESSSSHSQGWTSSSSNSVLTTGSSGPDEFADFASADTCSEDFAEFKQFSEVNTSASENKRDVDKFSALKALVQDKSLFLEKRQISSDATVLADSTSPSSQDTSGDAGWASFASGSTEPTKSGVESPDMFGTLERNTELTSQQVPDVSSAVAQETSDWANFESSKSTQSTAQSNVSTSAPSIVTSPESENSWSAFTSSGNIPTVQPTQSNISAFTENSTQKHSSTGDMTTKAERLKVDKSKASRMFSKNVSSAPPYSSCGASAYDMAPPELPDMKEEDDDFDEFGTFQVGDSVGGGPAEGISSLAAGIDDFGEFAGPLSSTSGTKSASRLTSQNMTLTLKPDSGDTTSMGSAEFSGWKVPSLSTPKEDSQSMHSLDLKSGQRDESPSGMDSQSVSSLDFAAAKLATPQDGRSVASLELQPTTAEPGSQEESGATSAAAHPSEKSGNSGDLNSTGVPLPENQWGPAVSEDFCQKPRDVSELLTKGDLITVGDRYSGLSQEPQDTDKHAYCWQRCLEKSRKLLEVAVDALGSTGSPNVCQEIVESEKGSKFIRGIIEVYRVICRIKQSMKSASISNKKMASLVSDVCDLWAKLTVFLTNTHLMPEKSTLNFSGAVLKMSQEDKHQKACGVCILNVDFDVSDGNADNGQKLMYGGRQYHSSCANFWVNCVDSTLPALSIPELL